jgi:hypothetical protein
VSSYYDSLEGDDLRHVKFSNTLDEVQKQILKTADDPSFQQTHQELAMVMPSLLQLRIFAEIYSNRLGPKLDASIFWGLRSLIVKVCLRLKANAREELLTLLSGSFKRKTVLCLAYLAC